MRTIATLVLFLLLALSVKGQEAVFGGQERIVDALEGKIYPLPERTRYLPDFDTLTPVGTLYTKEINVPPRSFSEGFPGVTDLYEWFGIEYKGEFVVKEAGDFTFRLTSDDGSKLFINDSLIVDNDGVHGTASRSGTIYLDASRHRIKVHYFQGPRHHIALQLFYTFNEVEQLFPGEDFDINIPGAKNKKWFWLVGLLILLGGGITMAQKRPDKKKERDKNCDYHYSKYDKGKSIALPTWLKKLRTYKPWIRELVCLYVRSDFSQDCQRKRFVERTLAAFKANMRTGWSVKRDNTIREIITQEPFYLHNDKKKWFEIENGKVKVSVTKPPLSVIGIGAPYFDKTVLPKKAPTAAKEQKSKAAINAILLIYILKQNADLIFENSEKGMSRTDAIQEVKKRFEGFVGMEFPDIDAKALSEKIDVDQINELSEKKSDTIPYRNTREDNRIKNNPHPADPGIEAIKVKEGGGLGEIYEGHNFTSVKLDLKKHIPLEHIRTKADIEVKKKTIRTSMCLRRP